MTGSTPAQSQPGTRLEGTPWQALFYAGAGGRLRPVLLGTEVTATFGGGRVSGSAGCNRYTGGYQQAQDAAGIIRVEPLASTQAFCAEPAGVMEQETAYLAALERAERFTVAAERLVLRTAAGDVLALYLPQPQRTLEGTDWEALNYNNGRQAVVSLLGGTSISARFEGGAVSGSAGCNRYNAGVTLTPGTPAIRISAAATTRMLCPEPAGVMEQETAYLAALERAERYRIEGDQLTLESSDGARQATYTAR